MTTYNGKSAAQMAIEDLVVAMPLPNYSTHTKPAEWAFVDGHTCATCGSRQITSRETPDGTEYSCHCGEEW